MAIETELKLSLSPESLNLLKSHPWLRSLSIKRAATHKLYSIYFDTPDLKLCEQRKALRLRRIGKHWIQTLKDGGSVQAGLHSRNEWESQVSSEALDFKALKVSGGHLPHGMDKNLQPIFITDFSRSSRLVNYQGTMIEIALDSGEIRANDKVHVISELELELKSGETRQLFLFAMALLELVPLQIELINKAEFGYRLWNDSLGSIDNVYITKAQQVPLTQAMEVKDVLQRLIWSCMGQIQANVPGAINRLNEEYLHQVRVALRRLRVVLSMSAKMRADPELNALRGKISNLGNELGRSREWDVFVTQTLVPIRTRLSQHAGITELIQASEAMRAKIHESVQRKLDSPDFQRLLLGISAWMYSKYWQQEFVTELPLSDFVKRVLNKRSKQVDQLGILAASSDAMQLHQFRIACKKLRYSAEMFGTLFGGSRHYLESLANLQQITGTLNDISVALGLLWQLESSERHETIILISGWLEHDYADSLMKLKKTKQHYSEQPSFW